ncbi:hypothetical protein IEQ34_019234 [Dendrobium chrysotoxum]|uniref:Uncharacterized protein n=1 Tax=Dendrobium chrysotoxum TaxID=161865 RepID=A0AAV7FQQ2_DENCH|nr:hypothetical protein IEQ34_019234 [Dendrobium chrysotoxum]
MISSQSLLAIVLQGKHSIPLPLRFFPCTDFPVAYFQKRLVIRGYFNFEKAEEDMMVISSSARVLKRKLVVRGRTILSSVPGNVISSSVVSSGPVEVFFLGAQLSDLSSDHVVSLGILRVEAIKKANGHLFPEEVILSRRFPKFWLPIFVLTGGEQGGQGWVRSPRNSHYVGHKRANYGRNKDGHMYAWFRMPKCTSWSCGSKCTMEVGHEWDWAHVSRLTRGVCAWSRWGRSIRGFEQGGGGKACHDPVETFLGQFLMEEGWKKVEQWLSVKEGKKEDIPQGRGAAIRR